MTEMANKRQRKKQYKKNMKEIARLSEAMSPKTLDTQEEINAWLFGDDEENFANSSKTDDHFWDESNWSGFRDSITDEDREWDTTKPVGKEKLNASDDLVALWRVLDSRKNDKAVDLDEMIAEVDVENQHDDSSDFWNTIDDQAKKYGSVDTPEVDWGQDVEMDSEDNED